MVKDHIDLKVEYLKDGEWVPLDFDDADLGKCPWCGKISYRGWPHKRCIDMSDMAVIPRD